MQKSSLYGLSLLKLKYGTSGLFSSHVICRNTKGSPVPLKFVQSIVNFTVLLLRMNLTTKKKVDLIALSFENHGTYDAP